MIISRRMFLVGTASAAASAILAPVTPAAMLDVVPVLANPGAVRRMMTRFSAYPDAPHDDDGVCQLMFRRLASDQPLVHWTMSRRAALVWWSAPGEEIIIPEGDALIIDWKNAPPAAKLQVESIDRNAEGYIQHVIQDFEFANGQPCARPPQMMDAQAWHADVLDEVDDDWDHEGERDYDV